MRIALSALATALAAASAPAPADTAGATPGFAARLAQMPGISGPEGWHGDARWQSLARAPASERQAARWNHALARIGGGRAAEAIGALDVMLADDADLALVPAFQLARGAAMTGERRWAEALVALSSPGLAANAEACAWRIVAADGAGLSRQALAAVPCALGAINRRDTPGRRPFVLAASHAAIESGQPRIALQWLALLPDRDSGANLLRGRAEQASGAAQEARLRLQRVLVNGTPEQRADARLSLIEANVANNAVAVPVALRQVTALRYRWRGGPVEARALHFALLLGQRSGNAPAILSAGATLMRYFPPDRQSAAMLEQLRGVLSAALAPDSRMALADAAGLYWDYRDVSPAGVDGDLLVLRLADRLEAAGLYARAAQLLDYQARQRREDVAQGPLSVRVAQLYILSGTPDRALSLLHDTEQPGYPDAMRWDRKRMEAIALFQMRRVDAATAALEDVPGGGALIGEFLWRGENWRALAAREADLPAPGRLSVVGQAQVLRHAVALAMLGREDRLAALRARYGAGFRALSSAAVFDALTAPAGQVDPARLGAAMAAIPSASAAGDLADLLDAATQAGATQGTGS